MKCAGAEQKGAGWLWIRRFCMIHSHPGHDIRYSEPNDLISSYSASVSSLGSSPFLTFSLCT